MQASFHRQLPLINSECHIRGIFGRLWITIPEKLWIQMFGTFLLSKHPACVMLSPLRRCMSVQKPEKSSSPRIVEMHFLTTPQQNPWCYSKACEIQCTQGHTEHVFLSSSRLYALRACHFRGSFLLWTHSVWATSPRHGQKDETGFSLVKAAKILCEPHVCKEDQPSK